MPENGHLFNVDQEEIILFCARECQRQHSGEQSVAWMLNAYGFAYLVRHRAPIEIDARVLGRLAEPDKNQNGYRNTPVQARGNVLLAPRLIEQAMMSLFSAVDRMDPEEFYREFEEVHPFIDGNGRVGVVLFNWLNHTLSAPVIPPDFWGDPTTRAPSGSHMEGTQ